MSGPSTSSSRGENQSLLTTTRLGPGNHLHYPDQLANVVSTVVASVTEPTADTASTADSTAISPSSPTATVNGIDLQVHVSTSLTPLPQPSQSSDVSNDGSLVRSLAGSSLRPRSAADADVNIDAAAACADIACVGIAPVERRTHYSANPSPCFPSNATHTHLSLVVGHGQVPSTKPLQLQEGNGLSNPLEPASNDGLAAEAKSKFQPSTPQIITGKAPADASASFLANRHEIDSMAPDAVSDASAAFAATSLGKTASNLIIACVDSGAVRSLTNKANWLVNVRPCSESFKAATGDLVKATFIGDLPSLVRTKDGQLIEVMFPNVRCVPEFDYTLLSVTQLWEELRYDAQFNDTKALVLPDKQQLGFIHSMTLPCLAMCSTASLHRKEPNMNRAAVLREIAFARAAAAREIAAAHIAEVAKVEPALMALGFHRIGSSTHVARLSAAQAAELLHRRCHLSTAKIRAMAHTTADAPKILGSAAATSHGSDCTSCAAAHIKRAPHAGKLDAPAPEPGVLHVDLKELIISIGGYRYVVFAIDEYSRFVFIDFIKLKSEVVAAIKRIVAAFNATVGTPVDEQGHAKPRPIVRALHSDREGGLMSAHFREFRADVALHHTTSAPHDHDLNPIPERIIGVISEMATAIRLATEANPRLWPWLIAYAVDWHNAAVSAVGSSTADASISPHQRFTLRPARVNDLAAFGSRCVVLKPPTHQHKPSLSGRGWVGSYLGRSRESKGCYDVLVGNNVVSSSSVLVDEEHFDWAPKEKQHQPLTAAVKAVEHSQSPPLIKEGPPAGSIASAPSTFSGVSGLRLLSLFSGPYARANGLASHLRKLGWQDIVEVDNDGERGGGWSHDLLNDATYSRLLQQARDGHFDAAMVAFPCSAFSVSRFFDASTQGTGDRGPPPLHTREHPDGVPESSLDPKHHRELHQVRLLLERTVNILVAARTSIKRTTIVVENPADRSNPESTAYSPELANHGSLFGTSAFKRLMALAGLSESATFAYCRLVDGEAPKRQKYTTLYFTPDASPLSLLNLPDYQCNHERGTHARVGGRDDSGKFNSSDAAAYPDSLNLRLAQAFTLARTGSQHAIQVPDAAAAPPTPASASDVQRPDPNAWPPLFTSTPLAGGVPLSAAPSAERVPPSAAGAAPTPAPGGEIYGQRSPSTPRPKQLSPSPWSSTASGYEPFVPSSQSPPVPNFPDLNKLGHVRSVRESTRAANRGPLFAPAAAPSQSSLLPRVRATWADTKSNLAPPEKLEEEEQQASSIMESAVADAVYSASEVNHSSLTGHLEPLTSWHTLTEAPGTRGSSRLAGGERAQVVLVSLREGEQLDDKLLEHLASRMAERRRIDDAVHALRADSPDAPATHAEALARGPVWVGPDTSAESVELKNHQLNRSWVTVKRDQVPPDRRIHKLIWVYKVKRDGTAKARLCVQGSTLEKGIDYDQVFAAALRYSSARALFAYAARHGCRVRSVDLVAAYLQGEFVDGEVVYCHLPQGYHEYDSNGVPLVAKVVKPIYGIQQAGRRLQRMLVEWIRARGFVCLDDSDPCVFVLNSPSGEILTVGLYVDNLQIVHSVEVNADGRGPQGCEYNKFMDALASDWKVTDEGPMEDLLGIEIDYLPDGAIKLHQTKYIRKIVERFLPNGPTNKAQRGSLPYSSDFQSNLVEALALPPDSYPELLKPFQQRVGCLMYATTSTRPDIAFAVHQLCQCLQRPTPALLRECDHVLSYLSRHASAGLTYTRENARLLGFSDASWETKHSTSGWVIQWHSAALTWGSRKQQCVALSTCEAELIALSEAAKDVVYLRKLVAGLGANEPGPTQLYTDSKAARDVSYNPEHHDKMKHVARRHFYVRDMVETFELSVPFVRTDDNLADFFTKPLSANKFHMMRKRIMNED